MLSLAAIVLAAWLGYTQYPHTQSLQTAATGSQLTQLFAQQQSGVWVELTGTVARTLSDDNKGSRHQRFIIDTEADISLLVAHNIDLAPRVPLHQGATIRLYGRYEWNAKGGVMHWTHADPQQAIPGGWIEYQGKRYR